MAACKGAWHPEQSGTPMSGPPIKDEAEMLWLGHARSRHLNHWLT
jgi:hypothetical protein